MSDTIADELRRLASAHPAVVAAMQAIYQAGVDTDLANRFTLAVLDLARSEDRKTQLALRMLARCPMGNSQMRYMPDVGLDYVCAIAGVPRHTAASVEFRAKMKTQCDGTGRWHPDYRGDVDVHY